MITIVYSHPYDKSFNHEILNEVKSLFDASGKSYEVINLYADDFNPVLGMEDYAIYPEGKTTDEDVVRYQKILEDTEQIVFIFPIWWGMMPAILKGFIDKTFLKGEIYDTTPEGQLMPCLDIHRTTVITTSIQDSAIIAPFMEGYFFPQVLNTVGMNNVEWYNCPKAKRATDAQRQEFVAEVLKALSI